MKDYYAGLGPAGYELLALGAQDMPVGTDEVREAMDAYRAEVLREAHDAVRADLAKLAEAEPFSYGAAYQQGMDWAARLVDQMIPSKPTPPGT